MFHALSRIEESKTLLSAIWMALHLLDFTAPSPPYCPQILGSNSISCCNLLVPAQVWDENSDINDENVPSFLFVHDVTALSWVAGAKTATLFVSVGGYT